MTHHQDIQDINAERSAKSGASGSLESFLRKFRQIAYLVAIIPVLLAYIICVGVSLAPGIYLFRWVSLQMTAYPDIIQALCLGLSLAGGFIAFILTLIVVVPVLNAPALPFIKPYRGPWFSLESIPWFYHNALTYLVRYTVLDFITPTPLNIFFFRAMGMKIGKACMINSSNISDPALIQLGDYVTIGGSAYLMAHYGMKGYLIIDHLKVGAGATVGLAAKVLGGVEIGRRATVGPNATVLPKTVIKEMEKFGVPEKPEAL
ncbi:hypothetical protein EZJ49_07025 [Bdellovibrio bacteriovorus]|uniref:hypothetical protein n=1 Tax=Bdellovibrio bacteriovorus TaxID=959 RepID=UPI0021D37E54|nr:hypothetical protein [Bdellovibrio bacteriovorus]UXR65999.1 hypothetical protein EZJ49_07025 [Bdellovibrio bacteriovorus]